MAANGPTTGAFQCRMLYGCVSGNSLREAKIVQFADANGRSWLLLDRSWLLLGYSWLLLSYSWGALGRLLAAHGPITGAFQCRMLKKHYFSAGKSLRKAKHNSVCRCKWPLLAAVGSLFGRSWAALGCSLSALGRSWLLLSRSWVALGRSWAALGPVLGAFQGRPCKKALFPRGKSLRKTKHRVFLGF